MLRAAKAPTGHMTIASSWKWGCKNEKLHVKYK
jgi:hypothetical protein